MFQKGPLFPLYCVYLLIPIMAFPDTNSPASQYFSLCQDTHTCIQVVSKTVRPSREQTIHQFQQSLIWGSCTEILPKSQLMTQPNLVHSLLVTLAVPWWEVSCLPIKVCRISNLSSIQWTSHTPTRPESQDPRLGSQALSKCISALLLYLNPSQSSSYRLSYKTYHFICLTILFIS